MVVNLSTMETKLSPIVINKAVEYYATHPNVRHKEVANELGISDKTLMKLRKDGNFWSKVYETYMLSYEGEIVDVVRAMLREAKAGNVQAGRLVMEHSGKLQKNLNIVIQSPFEKWLAMEEQKQLEPSKEINQRAKLHEVQDAEIVTDGQNWLTDAEIIETPEDVKDNIDVMDKQLIKRRKWLNRRRELHTWFKRAEAVGIAPLPARRPTKGQRLEWEMSIIRAEEEQADTNAES